MNRYMRKLGANLVQTWCIPADRFRLGAAAVLQEHWTHLHIMPLAVHAQGHVV
jgi:hypothetical protein